MIEIFNFNYYESNYMTNLRFQDILQFPNMINKHYQVSNIIHTHICMFRSLGTTFIQAMRFLFYYNIYSNL